MERTITPHDLQHYLQEIKQIEIGTTGKKQRVHGPSNLTLQNIFRYSSALNIMKTQSAGTFYQLAN